jgi:hypothetical protein
VSELKLDSRNARSHPERSVDAIAKSYELFGQQKPIVALPDGTVDGEDFIAFFNALASECK